MRQSHGRDGVLGVFPLDGPVQSSPGVVGDTDTLSVFMFDLLCFTC